MKIYIPAAAATATHRPRRIVRPRVLLFIYYFYFLLPRRNIARMIVSKRKTL